MGTLVTIEILQPGSEPAIGRALEWFHRIEEVCTRFDERSELMRLNAQPGVAVPASAILFEAVRFALVVAEESGGAFDPTIGYRMEQRGFDREHRTGKPVRSTNAAEAGVTYRDVHLDSERRTVKLLRPLTLDLGAVAKGLAVDAASRELNEFTNFAIDAGGDLYLGGHNAKGAKWSVGIRHPRLDGQLITSLLVSDQAVCTSGDYERTSPNHDGNHILDARTGHPANTLASVTVVAPSAMLADAVATAAFALGPDEGLQLLKRLGLDGLLIAGDLSQYATEGFGLAA